MSGRAPQATASGRAAKGARVARWASRVCIGAGALLILFVGVARLHSALASESDLARFHQARDERRGEPSRSPPSPLAPPDQSLWGEGRIAKYEASLAAELGLPIGVLRIPRLALEVPVWTGIDEITLNRGLGHIPGTAAPGEAGNVGVAGHRDGFFRVLQKIELGDEIELETLARTERFVVESVRLVAPKDVWVLDPTPAPALTLVTCYPFYFTGKAPERFIVRAVAPAGQSPTIAEGSLAEAVER